MFTLEVYGVKDILGIQYGFKGFVDKNYPPVKVNLPAHQYLFLIEGFNDLSLLCMDLHTLYVCFHLSD